MTKGKGVLSIAAVMVLGLLSSPVLAQGWTAETVRKTDGSFGTASATFVPVPGTVIDFISAEGPAVFSVTATETPNVIANSQIGVRVDGVDYALESNDIHTFAGGVAVFRIGLGGVSFVNPLPAGAHTAEVVLRRVDGTAGGTAIVAASAELPLNFVIEHN